MIERSDSPTEARSRQNEDRERRDRHDLEKSIDDFFRGIPPTQRFGEQKPSKAAKDRYQKILDSKEEFELNDVGPAVSRAIFNLNEWYEKRRGFKRSLEKLQTELESDLSHNAVEISQDLAQVHKWAAKPLEIELKHPNPVKNIYSFDGKKYRGFSNFVDALADRVEEVNENYVREQEKLAELGREVEKLQAAENSDLDAGEIEELGTSDEEVRKYERLARNYVFEKDIYDTAQNHVQKKQEYKQEFLDYKETAIEAYEEYMDDVEDFVEDAANNLRTTRTLLEKISREDPEELLEPGKEGLIDDGRSQLAEQYQETVEALETRAENQYEHLERSLEQVQTIKRRLAEKELIEEHEKPHPPRQKDVSRTNSTENLEDLVQSALGPNKGSDKEPRDIFQN